MAEHSLFIAHQLFKDAVFDQVRLPPYDHPWLGNPFLQTALFSQMAVAMGAAVRRAVAMREAGFI